jgi:hypothetical protein
VSRRTPLLVAAAVVLALGAVLVTIFSPHRPAATTIDAATAQRLAVEFFSTDHGPGGGVPVTDIRVRSVEQVSVDGREEWQVDLTGLLADPKLASPAPDAQSVLVDSGTGAVSLAPGG